MIEVCDENNELQIISSKFSKLQDPTKVDWDGIIRYTWNSTNTMTKRGFLTCYPPEANGTNTDMILYVNDIQMVHLYRLGGNRSKACAVVYVKPGDVIRGTSTNASGATYNLCPFVVQYEEQQ